MKLAMPLHLGGNPLPANYLVTGEDELIEEALIEPSEEPARWHLELVTNRDGVLERVEEAPIVLAPGAWQT